MTTAQQNEADDIAGKFDTLRDRVVAAEYSNKLTHSVSVDSPRR